MNARPALGLAPRHLECLLVCLRKHVPEAEVWAFGSRVTGHYHQGSDLDLVIRDGAQVGDIQNLRNAFCESSLPFTVDVLLWANLPADFRAQIEAHHWVVQAQTLG